MPECPVCFGEMDYDAMMRHDSALCRPVVRRLVEAALILDAESALANSTYPPDTDLCRAAWGHLREAAQAIHSRRTAARAAQAQPGAGETR